MWSRLCDLAAAVPAVPRRLCGLLGVQFLDTVIDMPAFVHVNNRRAENCGSSAVAVPVKVVDVFFVQFIDGVDSCSDVFAVLDIVVDMPVASIDWCFGLTEQNTVVVPQLQCSDKVNDVLLCRSSIGSLAGCASNSVHRQSSWISQCAQRRGGFQRGFGGDVGLGIFRAPPGRPGVERQFSEPSMTKSSLLSRAPAN